ncbi:MAG: dimethylargininase [Gammaproteobacteria bacterium]|nr:dimethylargininase [Gammaproteobacteria bacterium]
MLVAITRRLSPSIGQCELTHVEKQAIDVERADQQHRRYEMELVTAGCGIDRLPAEASLPDSVFVEDTAVVLDELAVMTRPGARSRRGEIKSVAAILGAYRKLSYIEAPGTLDGGDVLRVGRRLFVGSGHRSNEEGVAQLRRLLKPQGYDVVSVRATNCLHLKSAATCLGSTALLINPDWTHPSQFDGCEPIEIDAAEPGAANALAVGDRIILAAAYPRTRAMLEKRGYLVSAVDISELAKAEGAVTCCSLVFERQP